MERIIEAEKSELFNYLPEILVFLQKSSICFFQGEMGSGKTFLIKSLIQEMDGREEANSPTFSLINEYNPSQGFWAGKKIFHMDLYRLNSLQEAIDIGIEEYLYSGDYCWIEWPEIIKDLLRPIEYISIKIEKLSMTKRSYTLYANEMT